MPDQTERRRHSRLAASVRISYSIIDSINATPYEYANTLTEDISESGLRMLIDDTIDEGQLIYLSIIVPEFGHNVLLLGKTVHISKDPETQRNRVRIKFVGQLPEGMKDVIAATMDPSEESN